MRLHLLSLAVLASTASLAAQTNDFHVYTGSTSFTSRGFHGTAAGETMQGYPAETIRGVGHITGAPKRAAMHSFGMNCQDQRGNTTEIYRIIARSADDKGAPNGTSEGLIFRSGEIKLPTTSSSGAVAWTIVVNLGKDGVALPPNATYFVGVELSENKDWTSDGQSTWASAYTTPTATNGDPVRTNAPNNAWQVDTKGAVRQNNPRSWSYWLGTQRGSFQVGALQKADGDGLFGSCGMYPDGNVHGLAFRLRDEKSANKAAVVFVSDSLIGGAPLPFDGNLWVNPGTLVVVGKGTLDKDGELVLKPAAFAPGKLKSLVGLGNLPFQAAIVDVGNGRFDLRMFNAQAANL